MKILNPLKYKPIRKPIINNTLRIPFVINLEWIGNLQIKSEFHLIMNFYILIQIKWLYWLPSFKSIKFPIPLIGHLFSTIVHVDIIRIWHICMLFFILLFINNFLFLFIIINLSKFSLPMNCTFIPEVFKLRIRRIILNNNYTIIPKLKLWFLNNIFFWIFYFG